MNNESDLFKHFKNPAESGKEHRTQIQKFLKDRNHAVLAITSMQASGKTTSVVDEFARSNDGILLTQSNDKMMELIGIIDKGYPDLDYRPIYGLEQICDTYVGNQDIHAIVAKLRDIGIQSNDIHRIMLCGDECDFLTQDISFKGVRTVQTVRRFQEQITFGKMRNGLHKGRVILIDEADGLLNQDAAGMPVLPYGSERIDHNSPYLPQIYRLNAPKGTETALEERYNELISDIDGNKEEIKNTVQLRRLVTQGYYSMQDGKISELPPIFYIFQKVLERQMKLVIGTATMRNHRINFNTMQDYLRLAYEIAMENYTGKDANAILKEQDEEKEKKKLIRFAEKGDYLNNIEPEILEFEADYIPGFTDVYVFQSHKHSYSKSHYKTAFKGTDEELRNERWKELRKELVTLLWFYEQQTAKKPEKILLITFTEVRDEIERRIRKLKKSRNFPHDNLLRRISNVLPLFSNRMHGINANKEGYDLIITVGDPLDAATARFATDTGIIELNRKGFKLRKDADPALKATVMRTMLSELLEAFHRGRSEIPIIALSNFLAPDKVDAKFVKKVMANDNFTLINVYSKLWHMINDVKKHKGKWKENKVFLSSLKEEIEFDLSEKY